MLIAPAATLGPVGDGVAWPTSSGKVVMENILPDRLYQNEPGGYKAPAVTPTPKGTGRDGNMGHAKSPELV